MTLPAGSELRPSTSHQLFTPRTGAAATLLQGAALQGRGIWLKILDDTAQVGDLGIEVFTPATYNVKNKNPVS